MALLSKTLVVHFKLFPPFGTSEAVSCCLYIPFTVFLGPGLLSRVFDSLLEVDEPEGIEMAWI